LVIPFNNIKRIRLGQYNIRSDVYQAIQNASQKYKVPSNYMLAMAAKESGFDPNAKSTTSSATGLYQFIKSTWLDMWKDTKTLPQQTDPYASADAAARYVKQIQIKLSTSDPASLYLGHFLGPNGAFDLLAAYKNNPKTLVSDIVNKNQLRANKSIFYDKTNNPKTVEDIYFWSQNSINSFISKLG
jgi:soluble lytic murein transglycosylase-like protein